MPLQHKCAFDWVCYLNNSLSLDCTEMRIYLALKIINSLIQ